MKKTNDVLTIQKFSEQYQKEFDFYNASSLLAAQLIEAQLATSGIRAIVTSRAKNPKCRTCCSVTRVTKI